MKREYKKKLLASVVPMILSGAAAPITMAQSTGDGATGHSSLEEVTVTASRRDESLQDTGMSVTALDPSEFGEAGLTTLRDIVDYSPGVYYSGGSTPSDNSITMRGVSNFSAAPSVGIYIDDVPIGSGNNNASGSTLALDIMQMDIERVEIIKGPQGTLYGASSMGGLVRYITRDPSTEQLSGALSSDISVTEHGGLNQKYAARISTPVVQDKLGFSLSGFYEENSGFIDRIPEATSGADEDVNGFDSFGVMGKFTMNLTDRLSGNLMALLNQVEYSGSNVIALEGGPPFVLANGRYETDTSYSEDVNKFNLYALSLNYELEGATLISSTSMEDRSTESVTDLAVSFGPLVSLFSGEPTDEAPFTGSIPTQRFVQELRLTSKQGKRADWSLGTIYSNEESGNRQRLEGLPSQFVLLDVDIPSQLEELAAFGNYTYYVTPDFDLTAGARIARVETSVAVDDGPEIIIKDTPPSNSTDTIETYSLSARYRPTDDLSLYARAASGYRPENANLPLMDVSGNNVAPLTVKTDTLWSYEVGAKGSAVEGILSYDLAAWYLEWRDLQARVYVNGAMTGGNADSDVTAYGLEGTITLTPIDGLDILSSFAYSNSTLDDDETSAFGAVAGENLPGIPKWSASIRANYNFNVNSSIDGFFGGGLRYIGDRDTGFEGGIGKNGSEINPLIENFVLESHTIADLNLGIRTESLTATLFATNLLDEYAFSGGSARPAAGFIRATANVIEPRTMGVTIKYDY